VTPAPGPEAAEASPAPEVEAPPARRGALIWRVVLAAATVLALVVLVRRLVAVDLFARMQAADVSWLTITAGLSVLPVIGSALALVALTPGRLPFQRTVAVQLATSFVNLITPASAGGLALNVRYLSRRGLALAAAVAAVGIVQTTSILVTAVLVVGLLLASGRGVHLPGAVPAEAVLIVVLVLLVLGGILYFWGQGRTWLNRFLLTPVRDAWPQLRATLSRPRRLGLAVAGHLLVTLGFSATLGAALEAFGGSLSLVGLALIVVGSSAISGAVPVPGGIGAAEAALFGGLVTAGVESTTALSATLLYRLVTFWARVPIGWVALLLLQRSGDV
jgi:uncharacterized membrane protein YbhN (UPF0104 family)